MIGTGIGSVFLEMIGAFVRWTYISIRNRIAGKPFISFGKVWRARKRDLQQSFEYEFTNKVLGIIVIVLILSLLVLTGF